MAFGEEGLISVGDTAQLEGSGIWMWEVFKGSLA